MGTHLFFFFFLPSSACYESRAPSRSYQRAASYLTLWKVTHLLRFASLNQARPDFCLLSQQAPAPSWFMTSSSCCPLVAWGLSSARKEIPVCYWSWLTIISIYFMISSCKQYQGGDRVVQLLPHAAQHQLPWTKQQGHAAATTFISIC